MFKNDDMDEKKSIKKKRFLKKEEDLREWVGDLDLDAAFDNLDESNNGKITFEELTSWALIENVKIEMMKEEEKVRLQKEREAKD